MTDRVTPLHQDVDGGDEDEGGLTNPNEHRVFDSVVSNLRKTYPKDKMQDISTSFCFICLLHLANERGLRVEVGESPGAEDEEEPEEGDNKVGDLWGLKVRSSLCLHRRELIVILISGLSRSKRRSLCVREDGWIPPDSTLYILGRIYMFSIALFASSSYIGCSTS